MNNFPRGIKEHLVAQKQNSKRILWVLDKYFPDICDSTWSFMGKICLIKNDYGQIILVNKKHGNRVIDGIPVLECNFKDDNDIRKYIDWFNPNFVATHLKFIKIVKKFRQSSKARMILFLKSISAININENKDLKVVVSSKSISENMNHELNISSILVLPPIILPWIATGKKERNPSYISCVFDNLVESERIIANISKELPNQKLQVLFKNDSLRETEATQCNKLKDFRKKCKNFKNVTIVMPAIDPSVFYRTSKIILINSKNIEISYRTIVEGLLNKIPIIINSKIDIGLLSSIVYRIDNFNNLNDYIDTIHNILKNGIEKDMEKRINSFKSNFDNKKAKSILQNEIFI